MRKTRLRILIFLLCCLILARPVEPAHASGPGVGGRRVRLDDAAAGPYLVRAVTSPTPPTINNLYIEVRVTDTESNVVLTTVDVVVTASPIEGTGKSLEEVATHDIAPIPTEYAAHLPVDSIGVWEIEIHIVGEKGSGSVTFLERVQNPPNLGWVIAVGAPVSGLLLLAVIYIWLQKNAKSGSSD